MHSFLIRNFVVVLNTTVFLLACPFLGYSQAESNLFFEGTLTYEVEMKGPEAKKILLNEPNKVLQMHIKEGSYIVNLKGGKYPKSFIFVSDSNWLYSIDMSKAVAYKYFPHNDRLKKAEQPVAKYTGKTDTVNSVPCDIYLAKTDNANFLYYVSDQYKVNTSLYSEDTNAKANYLVEGLDGKIPLKTVKRMKGLAVITTVKNINPQSFSLDQFLVPPNFEMKKRDYRY